MKIPKYWVKHGYEEFKLIFNVFSRSKLHSIIAKSKENCVRCRLRFECSPLVERKKSNIPVNRGD